MMLGGIGTIFMLHRVAPYEPGRIIHNEKLKLSPDELEAIILELKKKKYVFLSLARLLEGVQRGEKFPGHGIVFTLDDGYRDNLDYAQPIFEKYEVPFCIYVTNGFPDRTTDLWWYALENLILTNPALRSPEGKKIDNSALRLKEKNFLLIRQSVLTDFFREPLLFFQQWGDLNFDLAAERQKICLSWDDIKRLHRAPLATIGAHTVNHYPLARLATNNARQEIGDSKRALEEKLGAPVSDFAFPFGSKAQAGVREYDLVASLGFRSAVTTIHGHIRPGDDPYTLRRLFLSSPESSKNALNRILYWNPKSAVDLVRSMVQHR
jgi:peptidoglycan/xylan/chitin deacetylase (PgdA/CDA1 family)